MENNQGLNTLLMKGVFRTLKDKGFLTEEELNECIVKIERDEEDVKSSGILQSID